MNFKDREKEYMREYFLKNRERLTAQMRRRYYEIREERIAKTKEWKLNNPVRAKEHLVISAKNARIRHRPKALARLRAYHAVEKGKIAKTPCVICGSSENLEAHHEDYGKPLEIIWLCRKHHKLLHRKKGNI